MAASKQSTQDGSGVENMFSVRTLRKPKSDHTLSGRKTRNNEIFKKSQAEWKSPKYENKKVEDTQRAEALASLCCS